MVSQFTGRSVTKHKKDFMAKRIVKFKYLSNSIKPLPHDGVVDYPDNSQHHCGFSVQEKS